MCNFKCHYSPGCKWLKKSLQAHELRVRFITLNELRTSTVSQEAGDESGRRSFANPGASIELTLNVTYPINSGRILSAPRPAGPPSLTAQL